MALWDEVLIVSRSRSLKGNAVVAREVARRYADKGILSYSCNPGTPALYRSYRVRITHRDDTPLPL